MRKDKLIMIDKDKKEKIDQIILNRILRENDINNSAYIKKLCKSVPKIAYLDWELEDIYCSCILALYETALKEVEKITTEEIREDNHSLLAGTYNYSKYVAASLLVKHRNRSHGQSYVTDTIRYYNDFEDPEAVLVDSKEVVYNKSYISRWFLANLDMYKKSSKAEEYLDYIEHYYARDKIDKNGNIIKKGAINYDCKLRNLAFTEFNKQFSNRIGKKISWNKKNKYTEEQQKKWSKEYSLIIDIAEILSNIDLIDSILSAKHIGRAFNKHKDIPMLFDLFYDNVSAASRKSINSKYYSIKSILELKNQLQIQRNLLINKLNKKEVELNDIKYN